MGNIMKSKNRFLFLRDIVLRYFLIIFICNGILISTVKGQNVLDERQSNLISENKKDVDKENNKLQMIEDEVWEEGTDFIDDLSVDRDNDQEDNLLQKQSMHLGQVEAKNTDVREVMEMIAIESGMNIVVDDDVHAKVTIFLKDVEAREALRIITEANNLAYHEESGMVYVMKAKEFERRYGSVFGGNFEKRTIKLSYAKGEDILEVLKKIKSPSGIVKFDKQDSSLLLTDVPASIERMESVIKELDISIEKHIFAIKYASLEEIAQEIRDVMTPDVGRLEFNQSSQEIVVYDTNVKIDEIDRMIKRLDYDKKKYSLDAKILQVILNDEHLEGIDWEAIVSDFKTVDFLGFDEDSEVIVNKKVLSLGTVNDEDYKVLLDALDTVGIVNNIGEIKSLLVPHKSTEIVIKPKEALLDNGNRIDLDLISSKKKLGIFISLSNSDENLLMLKINPKIIPVSEVISEQGDMDDASSPTSQNDFDDYGKGLTLALMNVKKGSTVVLGSLFKEVTVERIRKVPILGNIPLLGFVFRNQGKTQRPSEIIVFLTPQVISEE